MSDALHARILAAPSDLDARRVYADALLERGDPRGELIHVQLAPRTDEIEARERHLLGEHEREWVAPLVPWLVEDIDEPGDGAFVVGERPWTFRGGFVDEVELGVGAHVTRSFAERTAALVALTPLRRLSLSWEDALPESLGALAQLESLELVSATPSEVALPIVARLRSLRRLADAALEDLRPLAGLPLEELAASVRALETLAASGHRLRALEVAGDPLTAAMIPAGLASLTMSGAKLDVKFADAIARRGLGELRLRAANLQEAGAEAILRSGSSLATLDLGANWIGAADVLARIALPELASLELGSNHLGLRGAELLVESSLPRLRTLALDTNRFGDAGAIALARADWPQLRMLDLRDNNLGADAAAAIAGARWFGGLRALHLARNAIGGVGAEALAAAPALVELAAPSNRLTIEGVRALAGIATLEELDLAANVIGDTGVFELERGAARLRRLNLMRCRVGEPGAKAIADAGPAFAGLAWLNLAENALTDDAAEALARSPGFGCLVHLNLARNKIGPRGRAALRARFGLHVHL